MTEMPPQAAPYPVPQNSGRATTSMVLGIVGLVACGLFAGIPAGIVMGWIEVGIAILAVLIVIVVFALGGTIRSTFEDTCSTVQNGTATSC